MAHTPTDSSIATGLGLCSSLGATWGMAEATDIRKLFLALLCIFPDVNNTTIYTARWSPSCFIRMCVTQNSFKLLSDWSFDCSNISRPNVMYSCQSPDRSWRVLSLALSSLMPVETKHRPVQFQGTCYQLPRYLTVVKNVAEIAFDALKLDILFWTWSMFLSD